MQPITRKLLCHTAVLFEQGTANSWNDTEDIPIALSVVRIDAKASRQSTSAAENHSLVGTLFFDATHSLPKGQKFAPGQRIAWNGYTGTVSDVAFLYARNKLHHIEVSIK